MKKLLSALTLLMSLSSPAFADAPPIKIGDIGAYTSDPARAQAYRNGWEMARDEINASGGVFGRSLEIKSRDDQGDSAGAGCVAEDMVNRNHIRILTVFSLANIELAVSDFSKKNKVLFTSSNFNSDRLIWQEEHRYAFSESVRLLYTRLTVCLLNARRQRAQKNG